VLSSTISRPKRIGVRCQMDEYGLAVFIDVSTVVLCVGLLFRFGDLRLSHPAVPYTIFHVHTITIRLVGLLNGAPTLYSNTFLDFAPVRPEEIVRATLYADIALWLVTLVWIGINLIRRPRVRENPIMLDGRLLRPILIVAFFVGVVGIRLAARVPGVDAYDWNPSNVWSTSSYVYILPSWMGLAVLGHIYFYGFRRWTFVLLAIYLVLMAVQGGMRFRFIIGFLLAVQIWVEHRNRRWPSRGLFLGMVVVALLFFPMKAIGGLIQTGGSLEELSEAVTRSVTDVTEGAAGDQMFLDEYASGLTLIDLQGKKYMGSIYLPILTLPIPRFLWPDKPGLSDHMSDISTLQRPMGASGMIITYLGESYANFGLAGIFLVPPILALFLGLFYQAAYEAPRESVIHFSYLLLSVNLIQNFRDGLLSIIVFTFVNMMPLMIIVLVHLGAATIRGRREAELRRFLGSPGNT